MRRQCAERGGSSVSGRGESCGFVLHRVGLLPACTAIIAVLTFRAFDASGVWTWFPSHSPTRVAVASCNPLGARRILGQELPCLRRSAKVAGKLPAVDEASSSEEV